MEKERDKLKGGGGGVATIWLNRVKMERKRNFKSLNLKPHL